MKIEGERDKNYEYNYLNWCNFMHFGRKNVLQYTVSVYIVYIHWYSGPSISLDPVGIPHPPLPYESFGNVLLSAEVHLVFIPTLSLSLLSLSLSLSFLLPILVIIFIMLMCSISLSLSSLTVVF